MTFKKKVDEKPKTTPKIAPKVTTPPKASSAEPRNLAREEKQKPKHDPANDDRDELKRHPSYSDEAMLRLTNVIFDPMVAELCREANIKDEAQLLSFTKINSSREAIYWANQIAKEAYINRYKPGGKTTHTDGTPLWPIRKVRRVAFLLLRRSMPGTVGGAFALGVGLAQEQQITKSEEGGEEDSW